MLEINQADLKNLLGKLQKGQNYLKSPQAQHIQWRLDIFDEYKKVVTTAMGSVKAFGGHMKMSYRGEGGDVYWKNLSPYTLTKKAMDKYGSLSDAGNKNPYMEYRGDFSIWLDTGETKSKAVEVSSKLDFVGIQRDSWAYERAARTEFGLPSQTGKKVPPRPLFEIANFLFLTAIHKALKNPENELAVKLRQEIVEKLRKISGWGN